MIRLRYHAGILFLLLSSAVHAEHVQPSSITQPELFRMMGGLLLVLFLIMALSWLIKRFHPGMINGGNKGFQTIAAMGMGPKERLLLIKAGENYLLIAQGASSISLIVDYGPQMPEGFDAPVKTSFSEHLKSALGKKDS